MEIIIYLCRRKSDLQHNHQNYGQQPHIWQAVSIRILYHGGAFDDWSEERQTAMIIDITEIKERMLSGEDTIIESLLSGGDASACSKKK